MTETPPVYDPPPDPPVAKGQADQDETASEENEPREDDEKS